MMNTTVYFRILMICQDCRLVYRLRQLSFGYFGDLNWKRKDVFLLCLSKVKLNLFWYIEVFKAKEITNTITTMLTITITILKGHNMYMNIAQENNKRCDDLWFLLYEYVLLNNERVSNDLKVNKSKICWFSILENGTLC